MIREISKFDPYKNGRNEQMVLALSDFFTPSVERLKKPRTTTSHIARMNSKEVPGTHNLASAAERTPRKRGSAAICDEKPGTHGIKRVKGPMGEGGRDLVQPLPMGSTQQSDPVIRWPGSYISSHNVNHHALVKVDLPEASEKIPPSFYYEPPVLQAPSDVPIFYELNIKDVVVQQFHPEDTETHINLWLRLDSSDAAGGLTRAEFGRFCAKCVACGYYTSARNQCNHKCPAEPSSTPFHKKVNAMERAPRVPLRDVIALYTRFHGALNCPGISGEELEFMFVICPGCGKYITRGASYWHYVFAHID